MTFIRNTAAVIAGVIVFFIVDTLALMLFQLILSLPVISTIILFFNSLIMNAETYIVSTAFALTGLAVFGTVSVIGKETENGSLPANLITGILIILIVIVLYVSTLINSGFQFSVLFSYGVKLFIGIVLCTSWKEEL